MAERLVHAVSLPHLHLQQVVNQVDRCEERKKQRRRKKEEVVRKWVVTDGRGEKGGGGGGVESGPPVVTGRPGLMSKANMMLTFLQGSAV